jgi:copper(I)-binding protein
MTIRRSVQTALAAIGIAALAPDALAELKVVNPWVRATPGTARISAGYAELVNTGESDDQLVSVSSPMSPMIEMHESKSNNGIMSMSPVNAISISAQGREVLEPGGYHLMIMQLAEPLKAGDTIPLTFTFAKQGDVRVDAKVAPLAATSAP